MTEFENNSFENASLMLEVCRGVFERNGSAEAKVVRGLEITNGSAAMASLGMLMSVRTTNEEEANAVKDAIAAVKDALSCFRPLALAS